MKIYFLKIYETGILNILKQILSSSTVIDEQVNILTCLWNLCFDEKVCEVIKKDKELNQILANIRNISPCEEMQKKADGIMFTLNDLAKKLDNKNNMKTSHVMISYNWASRDMCLKIKDELKVILIVSFKKIKLSFFLV